MSSSPDRHDWIPRPPTVPERRERFPSSEVFQGPLRAEVATLLATIPFEGPRVVAETFARGMPTMGRYRGTP